MVGAKHKGFLVFFIDYLLFLRVELCSSHMWRMFFATKYNFKGSSARWTMELINFFLKIVSESDALKGVVMN